MLYVFTIQYNSVEMCGSHKFKINLFKFGGILPSVDRGLVGS